MDHATLKIMCGILLLLFNMACILIIATQHGNFLYILIAFMVSAPLFVAITRGHFVTRIPISSPVRAPTRDVDLTIASTYDDVCKQKECAICLETFVQGQPVGTLICGHLFHQNCISQWIAEGKRPHCPLRCISSNRLTEPDLESQEATQLSEREVASDSDSRTIRM